CAGRFRKAASLEKKRLLMLRKFSRRSSGRRFRRTSRSRCKAEVPAAKVEEDSARQTDKTGLREYHCGLRIKSECGVRTIEEIPHSALAFYPQSAVVVPQSSL